MNKVYKVIWNATLGTWVAVSELAKGKTKSSKVTGIVGATTVALMVTFSSGAMAAWTNGSGGGAGNTTGGFTTGTSTSGIAIGSEAGVSRASASGANSVAIGTNANATGTSNISLGTNAFSGSVVSPVADADALGVAGGGQIAIGSNSKTDTVGSIAIGANAVTGSSSNFAIAVGGLASAVGNSAIAFGRTSIATGQNAMAFGGRATTATGVASSALGAYANASGRESTAIGGVVDTTSVVTQVAATRAVAIGSAQIAKGADYSLAFGYNAQIAATGVNSIALGSGTSASASIAMGSSAKANGNALTASTTVNGSALALGDNANAAGYTTTAIGGFAQATQDFAIAIGKSQATNYSSVAMGNNAQATADYANAIGFGAKAQGLGGVAIGINAQVGAAATDWYGTAIGGSATAIGLRATAVGANANASGETTLALGRSANASVKDAVAIGTNSIASAGAAFAMGNAAQATATNAVGIGTGAVASVANSVALGSSSTTSAAVGTASAVINGKTYNYQGVAPTSVVSVGAVGSERQVQNVAAGRVSASSTDAINGSQLFQSNTELAKVATDTASALGGGATAGTTAGGITAPTYNVTTNPSAGTKTGNVNNVAAALTGLDTAVNQPLTVTGTSGSSAQKLGSTLAIVGDGKNLTTAVTANQVQVKISDTPTFTSVTANQVTVNNAPTAGTDAVNKTYVDGSKSHFYSVNNTSTTAANYNNDGATGTDSVAAGVGASATNDNAIALGKLANSTSTDTVAIGSSATASNSSAVAVGKQATASSTDTVALGTASKASNSNAIAIGKGAQATGASSISIGTGNIVSGTNSGAFGDPSTISGSNSYSTGNNNTITTDNTFVVGNNVTVNTPGNTVNGNVILGNASADKLYAQVSNGVVNGKTYTYAGTSKGVVSVGAAGAERQIVNVAPGAVSSGSTDAINGSQLFQTNEEVKNVATTTASALGGGSVANTTTGGITAPTYNVTTNPSAGTKTGNVNNVAAALTGLDTAVNQPLTVTGTSGSSAQKLGSTLAIVGDGKNLTTAVTANQVQVKISDTPTFTNVTANQVTVNNAPSAGTDATNKSYVDSQITGAKTIVAAGTNVSTVSKSTTGNQDTYTINANGTTASAGSTSVTVTPGTKDKNNVTDYNVDLSAQAKTDIATGVTANTTANTANTTANTANTTANSALTEAQKGLNFSANGAAADNVKLGETINFADGKNTTATYDATTNTYKYDVVDAPTFAGAVTANGFNANNNKITKVAAGDISSATSTDAVNGGQLFATNQNVSTNTTNINSLQNQTFKLQANGDTASSVKSSDTVQLINGNNIAITRSGNNVTVGTSLTPTFNNVTVNNAPTAGTDAVNKTYVDGLANGSKSHFYSVNNTTTTAANYNNDGATGTDALAAGVGASATKSNSTAVGKLAQATGANSTALGSSAKAKYDNSIALGNNAQAKSNNIVSVGDGAGATLNDVGAVGSGNTTADESYSVYIGTSAGQSSKGNLNTIIGGNNTGKNLAGSANTVLGTQAGLNYTGDENVMLGRFAGGSGTAGTLTGNNNVMLGSFSTSTGGNSNVSIGNTARVNGSSSIAVGDTSIAKGTSSIALGTKSQATGTSSISIGTGNIVTGNSSGAIGDPTTVTGSGTYTLGNDNGTVDANESGVIGNNNTLTTGLGLTNVRVVGNNNTVSANNALVLANNATIATGADDAVALGNGTTVATAGGVALGKGAVANTASGIAGYDPDTNTDSINTTATWKSTAGAVSVGDATNNLTRQITGVAAGTADTDAVNIAQLKATQTHYYSVNDNGTQGGNFNNDGATGQNALAAGVGSVATGTGALAIGSNANATSKVLSTTFPTTGDIAIGENVSAKGGFVLGSNSTVDGQGIDVAIGRNNTVVNSAYLNRSTISIGSNSKSEDGGITIGDGVTAKALGVAIGSANYAAFDGLAFGTSANAGGEHSIAIGSSTLAAGQNAIATGFYAFAIGDQSLALGNFAYSANANAVGVGYRAIVTGDNAVALGTSSTASVADSVALGAKSSATVGSGVAGYDATTKTSSTDTSSTWTSTAGAVSIGDASKGITRQINNLAAGALDTDAVNVAQLKNVAAASKTEVAAGTNITNVGKTQGANGQDIYTVNANGTTATAGSSALTVTAGTKDANNVTDYAVDLAQSTKDDIKKGADAKDAVDSKGLTFTGDSGTTGIKKLGDTVGVTGDSNITTEATATGVQMKLNPNLAVDSLKAGNSTLDNTGLTIAGGPKFTTAGIDAGAQQINNVAAGTAPTDAANVSQLNTLTAASKTEVAAGTNITNVGKTQGANGQDIYTVNANGTTTSAGSSALTVTAGTKDANNVTDYAVDLAQSTKDDIKKGADAKDTVDSKGLTFTGDSGTTGIKKLGDTVGITGDNNITTEATATGVQMKLNPNLAVDSLKAGNSTLDNTGLTIAGGPKFTTAGIDAGAQQINNVAAGTAPTDAANVSQLNTLTAASKTEVAAGTNITNVGKTQGANGQDIYTVNANGTTTSAGSSALTVTAGTKDTNNVTDYAVDLAQSTKDDIKKGADAKDTVDSKGLTFTGDSGTTGIKKLGDTVGITGDNNITTEATATGVQMKLNPNLAVDSLKAGNSTLDNTGLTIAGGPKFTTAGIDAGAQQINNVAAGTAPTDAANVSQLNTLTAASKTEVNAGTNITNVGKTQGANGQDIYTVNANGTTATAGSSALTVTAGAKDANNVTDYAVDLAQSTKDDIKKGADAKDTVDSKGLTFTGDSGTTGIKKLGDTVGVTGDNNITTEATATGVQMKLNPNLAVDSLKAGNSTLDNTGLTIAGGPKFTTAGIDAGSQQINNVAAGTAPTDAANVSQLNTLTAASKTEVNAGTNITNVGKTQGANGQDIYTVNANGTTATAGSSALTVTAGAKDANNVTDYAVDLAQSTKDDIKKGADAKDAVDNTGLTFTGDSGTTGIKKLGDTVGVTGDNNITTEATATGVQMKLNPNLAVDSLKAGNSTLDNTGLTIAGGPKFTTAGIDAGTQQINNVAAGTAPTDAANVSQLNTLTAASKTEVNAGTNITNVGKTQGANGQDIYTVNANGTTASAGSSALTVTAGAKDTNNVTDYAVDLAQSTKDDIKKGADAKDAVDSTGLTFTGDSGTTGIKKLGDTVGITGDSNITTEATATGVQMKLNPNLAVDSLKAGNSTLDNTGLTIAGGPKFTTAGIDAGAQQINNVAAGTAPTDAVNFGQLQDATQTLTDAGFNISAQGGTADKVKLGETVDYANTDGNVVVKAGVDNQITFDLAKNINVESLTATDPTTGNSSKVDGNNITQTDEATGNSNVSTANGNTITDATTGATTASTAGTTTYNDKQGNVTVADGTGTNVTDQAGNNAHYGATGSTITNAAGNTTTVTGDNITVGGSNPVTVNGNTGTVNGLSNTTWDPNNIVSGQAATEDQVSQATKNATDDLVNTGFNISAQGGTADKVKLGETVDYANTDGNVVVKAGVDNQITFDLAKNINVESLTATDPTTGNSSKVDGNNITQTDEATGNSNVSTANGNTITDATTGATTASTAGTTTYNDKQGNVTVADGTGTNVTDQAGNNAHYGATGSTITNAAGNTTTVTGDNITVGGSNPVTVNGNTGTVNGLSNTTWDPNNIVSGQAATEDQVSQATKNATDDLVNTGFNISAQGGTADKVKLGETVDYANTDGNVVVKAGVDNQITFDLAKNINVESLTATDPTTGNSSKVDGNNITQTDEATGNSNVSTANGNTITDATTGATTQAQRPTMTSKAT